MQLRAEITIAAEPAAVWRVLADVRRYPSWNPFLCELRGELAVGRTVELTLGGSDGYQGHERAVVTAVVADREFRLRSAFLRAGLIDTDYRVTLVERPAGTGVVSCAEVTGWLVKYTSSRRLTAIARGWVGMHEALKRRVEGNA